MRTNIKILAILRPLKFGLALLSTGRVAAQIFTVLHNFGGGDYATRLLLSGKTLYGASTGTVFARSPAPSSFTD